jgi:hypothetical protein
MLAADSASTRVLVFSCGCYFSTRVGRDTDCVIAVRIVTTCSIADGCIISCSSRWLFIHATKTPFLIAFRGQSDHAEHTSPQTRKPTIVVVGADDGRVSTAH